MNKEKQVEEMAYEMTQYKETVCKRIEDNNCLLTFHTHAFINCHFCKLAEHLITEKGYRKSTEVAREIFEEIAKIIQHHDELTQRDGSEYGELIVMDIGCAIAELKKKYAEEKGYMKEMIYSANRLNSPERIAEGEYNGLTYYVLNMGTHPCAYVDVTNTNLHGKGYDDIDIECHYGLTYASNRLATVEKIGWFIGWDYAHYGDFAGYELAMPTLSTHGKMWTTEEMVGECKSVIDQIKKKYTEGKG